MKMLFLVILFWLQSCATPCRPVFVHPQGPDQELFQQFRPALEILKQSPLPIGQLTYQSVCQGRAKLGTLKDLTEADYQQILSDLKLYSTPSWLESKHYSQLRDSDSKVLKELERLFDGHMWEDRIYLSLKTSAQDLAATIVHELNHVLNRSEVHYYHNQVNAFLEEFRAFYVQAIFEGKNVEDQAFIRNIQREIVLDYNLHVPENQRPLKPQGLLLPDETNWQVHWSK